MNDKVLILCPKTKQLVDDTQCIAIKNLSKSRAELFSTKICNTVQGCPKEDYCEVFERGWDAVGNFLQESLKD